MSSPVASPSRWTAPRIAVAAIVAAVAVAIAAVYAWELRARGPIAIDDAYITFSFAKNLALGHGPVYGHGVRVEGYSNFLWMLVVAAGLVFQPAADPIVVARIVVIPFALLLGYVTYRLVRLRASRAWALAAVAMCAINIDIIAAYLIGLETIAYASLLLLAFTLYLRSIQGGQEPNSDGARLARWVVPALVAAALTRIDGFVPMGFVLGFEAVRRLVKRRGTVRDTVLGYIRWAGPALVVYAAWFVWRWAYYGLPLPSTYYAKSLIPKVLPHHGLDYVREEVLTNGAFLIVPFALVLLARRRLAGLFVVLFITMHTLYVIRVGGDWMPYGRFLLPLFPLFLAVVAWGGTELVELARPRLGRGAAALHLLPLALFVFVARRTEPHITNQPLERDKLVHAENEHVRSLKASARLLNRALHPGARLVTDYGGVFAYYTDAAPIEMWGLCNAMIATKGNLEGINAIFGKTCPACYPALDPEFFHTTIPMIRDQYAFHSHREVVNNVWQTDSIGRYLDFEHGFVSGRVTLTASGQALYFLERRKPGVVYRPRAAPPGAVIDYPFEPQGRSPGM